MLRTVLSSRRPYWCTSSWFSGWSHRCLDFKGSIRLVDFVDLSQKSEPLLIVLRILNNVYSCRKFFQSYISDQL